MILNAFRAIVAGWGFQLNGDITGKLCCKNIDLVEFSVESIPKYNNVLFLGVIPKGTGSEKIYVITWDDFRTAAVFMCSYGLLQTRMWDMLHNHEGSLCGRRAGIYQQ